MGRPVKWNDAARADLARRWEAGEAVELIAEAHRTTAAAVYVQAAKQGLRARPQAGEATQDPPQAADASLAWLATPHTTDEAAARWGVSRRGAARRLQQLRARGRVVVLDATAVGASERWTLAPPSEPSQPVRVARAVGLDADTLRQQAATLDSYRGAIVAAWGASLTWDDLDRLAGLTPRTLRRFRGASARKLTEGLARALGLVVEEVEAVRAQLAPEGGLSLTDLATAGRVAAQAGGTITQAMRAAMALADRLAESSAVPPEQET